MNAGGDGASDTVGGPVDGNTTLAMVLTPPATTSARHIDAVTHTVCPTLVTERPFAIVVNVLPPSVEYLKGFFQAVPTHRFTETHDTEPTRPPPDTNRHVRPPSVDLEKVGPLNGPCPTSPAAVHSNLVGHEIVRVVCDHEMCERETETDLPFALSRKNEP